MWLLDRGADASGSAIMARAKCAGHGQFIGRATTDEGDAGDRCSLTGC